MSAVVGSQTGFENLLQASYSEGQLPCLTV